jgi:hypothetical protein
MIDDPDPDPGGRDGRSDHDPEREKQLPAPASKGGPLVSLEALGAALNKVNTASIRSRTGLPILLFKRDGDGTWSYGQKRTIVEAGSKWAVSPLSFEWGYVCFNNNKRLDERMVSVTQPKPNAAELPDLGFPWQEQWNVNLKCLTGVDTGVEVTFKGSTDGQLKWVASLLDETRDRLNGGQHDGKVSAVVVFGKDSYPHSQYGRVWTPQYDLVDWMPLDGPEPTPTPAPASPSPPTTPPTSTSTASTSTAPQQPRRRRVA